MSQPFSDESTNKAAVTQFPSPYSQEIYHRTSAEEKITHIQQHVEAILTILGMDLSHDSICNTPRRVASMYVHELCRGLDVNSFPEISLFDNHDNMHDLIVTKVSFTSLCEHHLVPMIGSAYIGYIPREKIIGLSKLSRITRYFAARPQLQERLCAQISDSLALLLGHPDIAVMIQAQHHCITSRGAQDEHSHTSTVRTTGIFATSPEQRASFFTLAAQVPSSPEDTASY